MLRLFLSAAAANLIGLGIGFLNHLSMAHIMSIEAYGLFNFIFSIAATISLFAGFGFHASSQRFIPGLESKEPEQIRPLIKFAKHLTLLSAFVFSSLIFSMLFLREAQNIQTTSILYSGGFMLALLLSVTRLQVGLFKAFKSATLAISYETIFREAALFIVLWGGFLTANTLTQAWQIIWAYTFILAVLWMIGNLQISKLTPASTIRYANKEQINTWLKISIPIMLLVAAQMLLHRADIIMLGIMRPLSDIGAYSFAAKISQACTIVFMAGTAIFAPRAAKLYQNGEMVALKKLYAKMQLFMGLGGIFTAIILISLFPHLLNFFDPAYETALTAFYILVGAYTLNAILGPSSYVMIVTHHEQTIMWVTFIIVIMNIILNWVLIPPLGITGAAIATLISLNLRNLIGYGIFLTDQRLKPETDTKI